VKSDVERIIQHYKAKGIKQFGIFGFCWGARVSVDASIELSEDIRASVIIHPSLIETDDADKIKCPTLALPTKDDADFVSTNDQYYASIYFIN
jgi:dienelactone hydrolase